MLFDFAKIQKNGVEIITAPFFYINQERIIKIGLYGRVVRIQEAYRRGLRARLRETPREGICQRQRLHQHHRRLLVATEQDALRHIPRRQQEAPATVRRRGGLPLELARTLHGMALLVDVRQVRGQVHL